MKTLLIIGTVAILVIWARSKWRSGLAQEVAPDDPQWKSIQRVLRSAGHNAEFYRDAAHRAYMDGEDDDDMRTVIRYANLGLELNDDRYTSKLYTYRAGARLELGDQKGGFDDYDKALTFLDRSRQSEHFQAWDASLIFRNRAKWHEKLGNYSAAAADRERHKKAEERRQALVAELKSRYKQI